MAIKHSITLSTTEPNNEVGVIKIRQADEQTQTLEVQITENGAPKSYTGLAVYFCAKLGQTAGLGIIEQKLNPEEMTNPANGKLEYTMRAEDWQILGRQRGYFSFRLMLDEHEFIDQFTTRDFTFEVIKSVFSEGVKEVKKDGSTYVWTIEDLIRLFNEYIATGKTDWEEFVEQNREVLESVDPGGKLIGELIDARRPFGSDAYQTLGERLDSDKAEITTQLTQTVYYSEIKTNKHRDELTQTDYWVTKIPHKDDNGEIIKLQHGFANNTFGTGAETVTSFSERNSTSFTANASVFTANAPVQPRGIQIRDGVVYNDEVIENVYALAFKPDNTMNVFDTSVSAATILAEGYTNVLTGFHPIVTNGIPSPSSIYGDSKGQKEFHPRQVIGQKENKDIVFITTDGRNLYNKGMRQTDVVRLLLENGCTLGYMLDGGGSTNTNVRGVMVNRPIDDKGTTERPVEDFLYVIKDSERLASLATEKKDKTFLSNKINALEAKLNYLTSVLDGLDLHTSSGFPSGITRKEDGENITKLVLNKKGVSYYDYEKGSDIFSITDEGFRTRKGLIGNFLRTATPIEDANMEAQSGFYWIQGSKPNAPYTNAASAIIHFSAGGTDALQLGIPYDETETVGGIKLRRTISNGWSPWRDI